MNKLILTICLSCALFLNTKAQLRSCFIPKVMDPESLRKELINIGYREKSIEEYKAMLIYFEDKSEEEAASEALDYYRLFRFRLLGTYYKWKCDLSIKRIRDSKTNDINTAGIEISIIISGKKARSKSLNAYKYLLKQFKNDARAEPMIKNNHYNVNESKDRYFFEDDSESIIKNRHLWLWENGCYCLDLIYKPNDDVAYEKYFGRTYEIKINLCNKIHPVMQLLLKGYNNKDTRSHYTFF